MTTLQASTPPPRRSIFRELFIDNPMREEAIRARRRFQRGGAVAGPALYYSVIGLIALCYLWILVELIHASSNVTREVCTFELLVVTFAMPLSIYSTIAGERERATWDSLVLTRLTAGQILIGKLTWRITSMFTLMAVLSLPIICGEIVHPVYGLSTTLQGEALVAAWGLLLAAFGLMVSALSKRSIAALGIIGASLVGVLFLFPLLFNIFEFSLRGVMPFDMRGQFVSWLHTNPFTAIAIIFEPESNFNPYSPGFTGERNQFNAGVAPVPVVYCMLAAICLFIAYGALKQLESPQGAQRAIRGHYRSEIKPHMGPGIACAVAFFLFTYLLSSLNLGAAILGAAVGFGAGTQGQRLLSLRPTRPRYSSAILVASLVGICILGLAVMWGGNIASLVGTIELLVVTFAVPLAVIAAIAEDRAAKPVGFRYFDQPPLDFLSGSIVRRLKLGGMALAILFVPTALAETIRPVFGLGGILRGQVLIVSWCALLLIVVLLISSIARTREAAGRFSAMTLISALVVFPLAAALLGVTASDDYGFAEQPQWRHIMRFFVDQNPFVAMDPVLRNVTMEIGNSYIRAGVPTATIFYFALSLVCCYALYRLHKQTGPAPAALDADGR